MSRPPRFPLFLIRLLANRSLAEEIAGDLYEDFLDNVAQHGRAKARRIYLWTAFCSLRPYLLAHKQAYRKPKYTDMVIYHLKMAFRSFSKFKLYSIINIFGLAVGFAASLAIALFVIDHKSMDRFLEDREHIYRLEVQSKKEGKISRNASLHSNIGPLLANSLPDIKAFSRINETDMTVITESSQGKTFIEERALSVDPDFFKVFSYELISGDEESVLTRPNTVVVTAATARKYFDDENPVGRTIKVNNGKDITMEIVGVVETPKGNSSLQFDILASNVKSGERKISFEGNFYMTTPVYFKLSEGSNPTALADQVLQQIRLHTNKPALVEVDYLFNSFNNLKYDLDVDDDLIAPTDARVIVMFITIGLFIIGLAIVNYINLSTARALQRSHEVGIRKAAGAGRNTLIWQFLTESLLTCLIALPIAFLLLEAALPYFEHLLSRELFFTYYYNIPFLTITLASIVGISLIAGLYPSALLSGFRFAEVIKGKIVYSRRSAFLRKGLIVFQFSFAITLIICAVVVQNQLEFIRQQTIGYEPEQVIIVNSGYGKFKENYQAVKSEMQNVPGVLQVSMASDAPGEQRYGRRTNPKIPVPMTPFTVDEDFFKIFNIELVKGKFFNGQSDSIKIEVIMNEALANAFETEDPLNIRHRFQGRNPNSVIGIVENFHFESLHTPVKAAIFSSAEGAPFFLKKIILKVETQDFSSLIGHLEKTWHSFYPDDIFEYEFLEDRIQNMYTSEQRLAGIFKLFTILAIFISCLGLFGLSTFIAESKMKEISIRKVLGASVKQMYVLLNRQVHSQILIASIIAVPTAYYFAREWLQGFAYKTDIAPLNILMVILLVMMLAGITLAFKTLQAALANPANNLRNE